MSRQEVNSQAKRFDSEASKGVKVSGYAFIDPLAPKLIPGTSEITQYQQKLRDLAIKYISKINQLITKITQQTGCFDIHDDDFLDEDYECSNNTIRQSLPRINDSFLNKDFIIKLYDLYESLKNLIERKCNEWKLTVCEYYNNDDVMDDMIAQVQKYQNLLSTFSDVVKLDITICSIDKVFLLISISELNNKCEDALEGK